MEQKTGNCPSHGNPLMKLFTGNFDDKTGNWIEMFYCPKEVIICKDNANNSFAGHAMERGQIYGHWHCVRCTYKEDRLEGGPGVY